MSQADVEYDGRTLTFCGHCGREQYAVCARCWKIEACCTCPRIPIASELVLLGTELAPLNADSFHPG